MIKFINKIIQDLILEQQLTIIINEASSALSNKTNNKFLLKLVENNNVIAAKTPLHFFFQNVTYFKYGAALFKVILIWFSLSSNFQNNYYQIWYY